VKDPTREKQGGESDRVYRKGLNSRSQVSLVAP
jgi:hypothetical protein